MWNLSQLRFIQFPQPETPEETRVRLQPRITQIANRLVMGLPHNLVHFGAKSAEICNDTGSDILIYRYDNAVNSLKLFIGYIQRMIEGDSPDLPAIETLVQELEDVTPDTVDEMAKLFRHQSFPDWLNALQSNQVRAGMNLETGMPNRLVYDINEAHTDANGEIDHTAALAEFHELSADCFNDAQLSEHDELVTERTVTPLEYFPTQ